MTGVSSVFATKFIMTDLRTCMRGCYTKSSLETVSSGGILSFVPLLKTTIFVVVFVRVILRNL